MSEQKAVHSMSDLTALDSLYIGGKSIKLHVLQKSIVPSLTQNSDQSLVFLFSLFAIQGQLSTTRLPCPHHLWAACEMSGLIKGLLHLTLSLQWLVP